MYSQTCKKRRRTPWRVAICAFLLLLTGTGCVTDRFEGEPVPAPTRQADRSIVLEVTGYCPCGECCGWYRNIFGQPVFNRGGPRGKVKKIGQTASGVMAHRGTVAADTSVFPFGTVMYIPGYGYGRVEDRGGAIHGKRIDLFFPSHREALAWGRRHVRVLVWQRNAPPPQAPPRRTP
jgi:3D (Asp-Asp-Asp) domain-containing protein